MNPFDPRTVALAKHAQHVVLIHFPIALFIAAVAFDYGAQWTKSQALAAAAYFNLLLAALSTIPVLATGLVAWHASPSRGRCAAARTTSTPDDSPEPGVPCPRSGESVELIVSTD